MQNYPQYCIVQQRHNMDGKRKKQNGCTQQTELVAVVISFLFIFSSNKSLSTPEFFLMVIKNTLIVSPRHSWPGIIPRNLQNFLIESGVFIYSYLCLEGTILNFWNLNLMSNPYVWPPDNENDWIILKCQWQLRKFREIQGYETLVLALLQACEVVA